MARPTVLIVDPNEGRRKEMTRSLAELGYEVVAAERAAEGMRFAIGLNPSVMIADASLDGFGDAAVLKYVTIEAGQARPKLALLGPGAVAESELPDDVTVVAVEGLTTQALVRKARAILVGRELSLEPDARLESLVGDLQLTPFYELLPQLQKAVVSGRLVLDEGEVVLEGGEVVGARAGSARGEKAFARLGRIATGSLRLLLGAPGIEREVVQDLLSLMAMAMEDQYRFNESLGALPDWDSRARLEIGPAFFSTRFSAVQQALLQSCQGGRTLRALVEVVPHPDGEVLEEMVRLREMGFLAFDEPEIRVRVVTDSTADLPPEVARTHAIEVVPLSVIFGEEIFKDGPDLTPGAFYKLLEMRRDVHPRTNPPTRGEFAQAYARLTGRQDVVSIHISEKMSQTVVHARAAAGDAAASAAARTDGSKPAVEVCDSLQVSAGLGLLVLCAARMARRNLPAAEITRRVAEMQPRLHLLFVVDTLEYLARGGRIGKAQALLGGLLGIKPILGLVGGEVAPVDRVRGGKAAHPRVVELFKERVDASRPVMVAVAHAAAPIWADRMRTLLQQHFIVSEMLGSEIGPVVGAHVGPGCVGAVVFQPTDEEAPLVAPLPEG
jgi:DegV family protein with EDD domain